MRCDNPKCNKHIGLKTYRLSALGNLKFHTQACADEYEKDRWERLRKESAILQFLRFLKIPE